ncbi:CpaD family pilus assembly protein [Hansschlegelia beijingensis]|uniref:Pilus assembly protein CpaD n=1 Tax=Hansschlegelia beijingensis TaxID=1133344 RepID=A0A7W6D358_9HYPH|nr:CpaD family pilus assembly protein [Hansschlegelia beijingensis]MBB3973287.1 pilus assembly protein CpaD [Hansschlegelia beijingensis]
MTSLRHSPFRAALAAGAVAASALTLAGCHGDRIVADSYPQTYAQRHPIVLAEGAARLDLPVGGGRRGLTDRQRDDIRAFAADWRKNGRGPVGMLVPAGGASAGAADYALPAIRTTLAAAGVPATSIVSQRYPADGAGVAPVKLGFVKLKAKVPHPCGLWPEDLGYGGGDLYGETQNREYWNFGCAAQQNLAAQVADPEDLARPRTETPVYAARRQTVMEKYRAGTDTTTDYRQSDVQVSTIGGGN